MSRRPRILVTGFSGFPGARRNPTEALVGGLDTSVLSERLGIDLSARVLPTEYSAAGDLIPRLWDEFRPDAVIHFGLHGRAGRVRVETRAKNYASPLRPDAAGRHPARTAIEPKGPPVRQASLPASEIVAAMHRRGVAAVLSGDAGDYLCNFASYLSLGLAGRDAMAGFVHLPWPAGERAPKAPPERPSWQALQSAVETAIRTVAICARARVLRTSPLRNRS